MSDLSAVMRHNDDGTITVSDQYCLRMLRDGKVVVSDRTPGDAHKLVLVFSSVEEVMDYYQDMNKIRFTYQQNQALVQARNLAPDSSDVIRIAREFFNDAQPMAARWGHGVFNDDVRFIWSEAEGLLKRPLTPLNGAVTGNLLSASRVPVNDGYVNPLPFAGLFGNGAGNAAPGNNANENAN